MFCILKEGRFTYILIGVGEVDCKVCGVGFDLCSRNEILYVMLKVPVYL